MAAIENSEYKTDTEADTAKITNSRHQASIISIDLTCKEPYSIANFVSSVE